MVDAHQHAVNDELGVFEVFEGEVGFGELALADFGVDDVFDEGLELFRALVFHGAGGCLDGVGDHEDGHLAGVGEWARVAKVCWVNGFVGVGFDLHTVEELYAGSPMVGPDKVDDFGGEVVLVG